MMKHKNKIGGLAALLMLTAAPAAYAAGTDAGTLVSNSIDVSYVSGGETITVNDADTADFVVDRRVDLSLEGQDAGKTVTAAAGAEDQVLTFLLTNEGNDGSGYDIDVTSSGTIGLTYDPAGAGTDGTYYTVLSTDAVFDAGDTTVDLTGDLNDQDLAADGQIYVLIVANTAGGTADGLQDTFDVTATALDFGTATVSAATPDASMTLAAEDTVLADTGNDGTETDSEDLIITAPQLTFTKGVIIVDENIDGALDASGCASAAIDAGATASVPGSCLQYTITVTNAPGATSSADTLAITDALPVDVTYANHTNSGFTAVNFDGALGPKGTVTGNLTTLAPGASASFNIRVLVD
jgi:uncharacterized repeat protein (TIGR01451 family)